MGRAGRVTPTGMRAQTVLYVLFNSQVRSLELKALCTPLSKDLGNNVKGMSDGVRKLCLSSQTCLRSLLKGTFVGEYAASEPLPRGTCCSVCDNAT